MARALGENAAADVQLAPVLAAQRLQRVDLLPGQRFGAGPEQRAAQYRPMGRAFEVDPPAVAADAATPREVCPGQRVETVVLDPRGIRVAGDGPNALGIAFLELRQHMQPNGVAGVVGHGVCGVLPPGQALAPQVIRQLGLAAAQQGPPQVAAERAHAGRAAGTGAAGQVHQHRLCLVVHVVGQGDEVRAKLGLEAPQLFIAQPSRRRFQAFPSLARLRRHIQAGAA